MEVVPALVPAPPPNGPASRLALLLLVARRDDLPLVFLAFLRRLAFLALTAALCALFTVDTSSLAWSLSCW